MRKEKEVLYMLDIEIPILLMPIFIKQIIVIYKKSLIFTSCY